MTDAERFDAVEADPDFHAAMAHEPRVPTLAYLISSATMLAFSLVFAVTSLALLIGFPAPVVFKALWIAMTGVFVALGLGTVARAWRYHAAPIQRFVAIVVGTRTQISGSGSDGSTTTTYFATLQSRDGTRTEYHAIGSVVGLVAAGDIGVAYVKSQTLVSFRRFGV